jgi:phosphohistidine swiveling domain-containing protein
VHVGDNPPAGAVLVVTHLDPRLATVVPRLSGLVAETGSPLSHLAILAREHGVPTVVGHAGATERYRTGQVVEVDGTVGSVRVVEGHDEPYEVVVEEPSTTVITLPAHPVVVTGDDGDDSDDDPDRNAGTAGTVIQMGARR